MTALALDYPLGRPIVEAVVRRARPLAPAATPLVGTGDLVRAEQPIAETPEPNGGGRPMLAGLGGRVVEVTPGQQIVIEGPATVLQGPLGLGGPAAGPLMTLPRGESIAVVPIPAGAVILHPQPAPLMLLQRAAAGGAVAVVAGSVSARELEAFARCDLSALLDGSALTPAPLPLTILLTEGLGAYPMGAAAYQLLAQQLGRTVLVQGTTAPRRNLRPELLLSLPAGAAPSTTLPASGTLDAGAQVLITTGARRGASGRILSLCARHQLTPAGLLAPCAYVRLDTGSAEVVPLYALERIG
jgi:hypothetical protein